MHGHLCFIYYKTESEIKQQCLLGFCGISKLNLSASRMNESFWRKHSVSSTTQTKISLNYCKLFTLFAAMSLHLERGSCRTGLRAERRRDQRKYREDSLAANVDGPLL